VVYRNVPRQHIIEVITVFDNIRGAAQRECLSQLRHPAVQVTFGGSILPQDVLGALSVYGLWLLCWVAEGAITGEKWVKGWGLSP
jgi:hypothetical protein